MIVFFIAQLSNVRDCRKVLGRLDKKGHLPKPPNVNRVVAVVIFSLFSLTLLLLLLLLLLLAG
jgi:hypothetical protein